MDNNMVKVFESAEFGSVRTVVKDGEPWFVASDVCKALGLHQITRAMSRLDADEGGLLLVTHPQNAEKTLEVNCVNESGLYHLILCSNKPAAKAFKRWVTHEVIPSIRQTGAYMTDDAMEKFLADPNNMIKALTAYKEAKDALVAETQAHTKTKMLLAERDATIKENEPKVLLADAITDSDGCISIGELAKILAQNGANIGRNRLYKLMRDDGYLMSGMTEEFNSPTQKSVKHGWMRVKESTYFQGNFRHIKKTPRITGKGQLYFVNKYAKKVG